MAETPSYPSDAASLEQALRDQRQDRLARSVQEARQRLGDSARADLAALRGQLDAGTRQQIVFALSAQGSALETGLVGGGEPSAGQSDEVDGAIAQLSAQRQNRLAAELSAARAAALAAGSPVTWDAVYAQVSPDVRDQVALAYGRDPSKPAPVPETPAPARRAGARPFAQAEPSAAPSAVPEPSPAGVKKAKELLAVGRDQVISSFVQETADKLKAAGNDLDAAKRKELEKLCAETFDSLPAEQVKELARNADRDGGLRIGEVYPIIGTTLKSATGFLLGLVGRGIVPLGGKLVTIGLHAAGEYSKKQVALSCEALGIDRIIPMGEMAGVLEKMGDREKQHLAAVVYREGGLFWSLAAVAAEYSSRMAIAVATNTFANGFKVFPAGLKNDYLSLADEFARIEKGLDVVGEPGSTMLRQNVESLKGIQKNWHLLDVARATDQDAAKFLAEADKRGIPLSQDFRRRAQECAAHPNQKGIKVQFGIWLSQECQSASCKVQALSVKNLAGTFVADEHGRTVVLQERLNHVVEAQQRMATYDRGSFAKLGKLGECVRNIEVSRQADRVVWGFKNKQEFQTTVRELAAAEPHLVRGLLDKMPVFMLAGFAMQQEDIIGSLRESWMMLLPIVGPIMIIGDAFVGMGKEGLNGVAQAGMGVALLSLDGIAFADALRFAGATKGASVARFIAKPIADVYDIAKGATQIAWEGGKLASTLPILERFPFLRSVANPRAALMALLVATVVLGYELLSQDEVDKIKKENGITDAGIRKASQAVETWLQAQMAANGFSGVTVARDDAAKKVIVSSSSIDLKKAPYIREKIEEFMETYSVLGYTVEIK